MRVALPKDSEQSGFFLLVLPILFTYHLVSEEFIISSWFCLFLIPRSLVAVTSEFSVVNTDICVLRVAYIHSFLKNLKSFSYASSMISWYSEFQRLIICFAKSYFTNRVLRMRVADPFKPVN